MLDNIDDEILDDDMAEVEEIEDTDDNNDEYEKISSKAPLSANCPGDETKSTFSKPREFIMALMSSYLNSSPL